MASKDETRYGWKFPDGTVIPEDDEWGIQQKLESMDSFREKLSNDELLKGYWYTDHYYDFVERDIDGLSDEDLEDIYGVKKIYPRGNGAVRYRLPDGSKVDESGLFDWIVEEGYPLERWFEFEQYGDEFNEYVREEIERMLYWKDDDDLSHYGIRRIPLRTKAPKSGSCKGKAATTGNGKAAAKSKSSSGKSKKAKAAAPPRNARKQSVPGKSKGRH